MPHAPPDDLTARHLSKVVESSDDAIVSKDLNGIIKTWNRAAERMFGYSAAEAVGRSIRMIIPADRQTEEDAVLARIRAGEAVAHFETIRLRKDGSLVPISLTVSPIHDDAGTVIGASKIARDITERKRADAAAAAARSRDRIIGRCDRHQEPRQHHHVLESCGGTDVRLHLGGSDRAIDSDAHSGRPAGRGRHGARQDPGRRDRRSLRDGSRPEGRRPQVDFVDGLTDPRRLRAHHRRLQDRPGHHRAIPPAGRCARAGRDHTKSWARLAPPWRPRWSATSSSRR